MRRVARGVIGDAADDAHLVLPSQGVNNRTCIIHPTAGPSLVLKVRPGPARQRCSSPQWPRYCRELFGPVANGGIETLAGVTELLTAHGSLRVPRILLADTSLELLSAPYIVSEYLPGVTFDWELHPLPRPAILQLGEHLARVHAATRRGRGFGIFAQREPFPAARWWERFSRAYQVIAEELCRDSAALGEVRSLLDRALARAVRTGEPAAFALICVDQTPTHYLTTDSQQISGMADIEGHLWAPPEYELAMVELWVRDLGALGDAYGRHLEWPKHLEAVRPAYQFFTWMEWIYCLRTLLHEPHRAAELEQRLAATCRGMLDG